MGEASDNDGVHAEAQPGVHQSHTQRDKMLQGKFYDLHAEHAKLLKYVHENPYAPARILGACVEYLKHGTPEMIRLADAVDFAVKREVALIQEQIKKGVPI